MHVFPFWSNDESDGIGVALLGSSSNLSTAVLVWPALDLRPSGYDFLSYTVHGVVNTYIDYKVENLIIIQV